MSSADDYVSPLMGSRKPQPLESDKVFTLPMQQKNQPRPKVQNFSAVYKVDPSWPRELVEKFSNSHCYLCNVKMTSESSARSHYQGGKHNSKINNFLSSHGSKTGETETKGLPKASTTNVPPGKKNPVQILQEQFKDKGLEFIENDLGFGMGNVPEFECIVAVGGQTYKSRGSKKKLAKTNAAEAAVQALMQQGIISSSALEVKQLPSGNKNPISFLNENYKGIIYHEKDLGMGIGNSHQFECSIEVEGETYKAVGESKKAAKTKAAESAMKELQKDKSSSSDSHAEVHRSPLKMLKDSGSDSGIPTKSACSFDELSLNEFEDSHQNYSSHSDAKSPSKQKMIRPDTSVARVPKGPELNPNNFILDYTGLPKIKIHSDGAIDGKPKSQPSNEDIAKNAVNLVKYLLKNVLKAIRNKEKEKSKPKKRKADGKEPEDPNTIGNIDGRHCLIAYFSLILTKEIWLGRKKYTKAMKDAKLGETSLQHEAAITDNQVADAEYGRGSIGGQLTMHFDIHIWQDTEEPEKILVTGKSGGSERVQTQMMKPMFPWLASMAQSQLQKANILVNTKKSEKKD